MNKNLNSAFTNNTFGQVIEEYEKSGMTSPDWNVGTASLEVSRMIIDGIIPTGSSILDLGCGHGQHSIMFAMNRMVTTGIDIMQNALSKARKLAKLYDLHIDWVHGDILEMPFSSHSFDFVHDHFIFHNVRPDKREIFAKEVYRVLNPGGMFIMTGFSDKMEPGSGPIRLTSTDIINTFNPYFICEHLERIRNFPTQKRPAQIHWFSLWKKQLK